jgi:hypothetical protein
MEQNSEWNGRLCLVFIDFEKVFDSVSRDKIWKLMERFGLLQLRGLCWTLRVRGRERKTKGDLEKVSYGRDTERRKDMVGGEEVGCGQRSL